jgi:hypothetical protein
MYTWMNSRAAFTGASSRTSNIQVGPSRPKEDLHPDRALVGIEGSWGLMCVENGSEGRGMLINYLLRFGIEIR